MKLFLTFIFLSISISLNAQRWPLNPQNTQYPIVGTIGEDRGGRSRFHKGCDISETAGTFVLSIEDGIVNNRSGAALCVGTYCYIHVVPLPSVLLGDTISFGDTIGVIQRITNQHIHLQKTDSLYNRIGNVNSDNILWRNPLDYMIPFNDNISPDIQELYLYEYRRYNRSVNENIYGNIDVIVNVTDPRIDADGGNGNNSASNGVAPYSLSYFLLSPTLNDTFFQHHNSFEFSPNNANSNLVFTPESSYLNGDFEYYLNSFFRDAPIRRPFNLRVSINDGISQTPDSVVISDGNEMVLKVTACDRNGNCDDQIYSQNGSNLTFTLDNFKPYIKSITAKISGVEIYNFEWKSVDGKLEPRGGVVSGTPAFTSLDLAQGMVVEIEASEQLHDLSLQLERQLTRCSPSGPSIISSTGEMDENRKKWTFTFGDLSGCPLGGGEISPTGTDWRFLFNGHDFGPDGEVGSELLQFSDYDVVDDEASSIAGYSLGHRIGTSGGNQWSTQDARLSSGTDKMHYFRFDCARPEFKSPDDEEESVVKSKEEQGNNKMASRLEFICCSSSALILDPQLEDFDNSECGPIGTCERSLAVTMDGETDIDVQLNFQFRWSTGARGQVVRNLCSGTYSVTATSNLGCEYIKEFTVCCLDLEVTRVDYVDETGFGRVYYEIHSDTRTTGGLNRARIRQVGNSQWRDVFNGVTHGLRAGDYHIETSLPNGCTSRKFVRIEKCSEEIPVVYDTLGQDHVNGLSCFVHLPNIRRERDHDYRWEDGERNLGRSLCEDETYRLVVTNQFNCEEEIREYYVCGLELIGHQNGNISNVTNEVPGRLGEFSVRMAGTSLSRVTLTKDGETVPHEFTIEEDICTVKDVPEGYYTVNFYTLGGCSAHAYVNVDFECYDISEYDINVNVEAAESNTESNTVSITISLDGTEISPADYNQFSFALCEISSSGSVSRSPVLTSDTSIFVTNLAGEYMLKVIDACDEEWEVSRIQLVTCGEGWVDLEVKDACNREINLAKPWFKLSSIITDPNVVSPGDTVSVQIDFKHSNGESNDIYGGIGIIGDLKSTTIGWKEIHSIDHPDDKFTIDRDQVGYVEVIVSTKRGCIFTSNSHYGYLADSCRSLDHEHFGRFFP